MSAKHTPGPWETPGTDAGARVVCATLKGKRRTIAHVYAAPNEAFSSMAANARLIAAAPDLLAALEAFMRLGTMNDQDAINAARTALARAKGEE